ncbi:MAG: CapA family protein [Silvanigrellales bacterium]|nr:CapA family protein [Silvanigrellales bacterium]
MNLFGDVYISMERALAGNRMGPLEATFANVEPMLGWAHFNVVNLEGVITKREERAFPDFPFALRMHPGVADLLAKKNILHVTRANNHSMDFGLEGMRDTSKALRKAGITWTGVGENVMEAMEPLLLERDGIRIGILSFTTTYPDGAWASETKPGVPYPTASRLEQSLGKWRKNVDWLIAVFHWGEERNPELKPHQPELARIALAAGANMVVGHHAHLAQAIGKFEEKWAIYGLGNFAFDSNSPAARFGLGMSFELCRATPTSPLQTSFALVPLDTFNLRTNFSTRFMSRSQFDAGIAPYLKKKLVPFDAPFYVPGEPSLPPARPN